GRVVFADFAFGDEFDPFGGHEIDAALDDALVELHVGNAVHEQAADSVGALEDRDLVASAIELRGTGQSRGAGADHGDLLASPLGGRLGNNPALLEGLIDDGTLNALDRDGRLDDAEHAGAFARGRTDSARELGEIVCFVQTFESLFPEAAINQV